MTLKTSQVRKAREANAARKPSRETNVARKPRRGRPVGDHEAKRAELLEAAEAVIAKEGLAATSLRKVARRAGGTTGAVTYYFENKDAMITAVAAYLYDKFEKWLLDAIDDSIDIRKLIEDYLVGMTVKEPEIWLVILQVQTHALHKRTLADLIQRRYMQYRHVLADAVAKGQEQGIIRNDIPADILADQISAMSDGWALMYPIERERFKPRRFKALLDAVATLISPVPGRDR